MAEIFYRTYPKKLNKDKSDLGFVDIYDLDKRFMLAKILGIDCLIIEDIFKKDMNNFFDYSQVDKNLGQTRDFVGEILLCHEMSLSIILRIDINKINGQMEVKNILAILNFWIDKGVDGFLFDDCKNSKINFREVLLYLKKSYKNLLLIVNTKNGKEYKNICKIVDLSYKSMENENLKEFILHENKNSNIFSLNDDFDFSCLNFLDFKHFYTISAKLIAIITLIRQNDIFIKEGEETLYYLEKIDSRIRKEIFDFYRKIFLVRYDYLDIIKGGYFPIKLKDKDVLSYMFYNGKKALVILNDFCQKDIIVDLPKFIDIRKSTFVIGNISKRTIVKNINLRAYESFVFETYIK